MLETKEGHTASSGGRYSYTYTEYKPHHRLGAQRTFNAYLVSRLHSCALAAFNAVRRNTDNSVLTLSGMFQLKDPSSGSSLLPVECTLAGEGN